ncbi:hypothetical protein [Campylobacter ureolyticus]|uniref:hypothetical protein n=1 Tax=Campylobacter ureolyticus TaxID=827 RepID=UPI0022B393A0|nr:hypothetical protein [Campylobacter ureolyticus]MCZ6134025.1 hypothetical protein [Campylobacter ureolyticus]MCZ6163170.1 hypothetical protein [Campylobacter ureolyticus]MCZ6165021.1 hypothetical protein [Campylobacter ureolyticus]
MRVKIFNLAKIQISIIIFLTFISDFIRFLTQDKFIHFSIMCLLFIFILANIIYKKFILNRIVLYLLCLFITMFICHLINLEVNLRASILFLSYSVVFLLLADYITEKDINLNVKISFWTLVILYVFFILSAFRYGLSPDSVNSYLNHFSRNILAAMFLFHQILYSSFYFKKNAKLPIVTTIFTFIISIFCYGRSGIFYSFILLFFSIAYNAKGKNTYKYILTFIFFLSLIFLFLLKEQILLLIQNSTNFKYGLDSPRFSIIEEYFKSFSFYNFIFGLDLSELKTIQLYDNNTHNFLLQSHSQFGIFFIIFIIFIIFKYMFKKKKYVYLVFTLILLSRGLIDTIVLFANFDFILYIILLISIKEKKCRFR